MKSLCSTLKTLSTNNRTNTLSQLITTTLTECLSTISEPTVKQTVERYIEYLKSAKMGQLINGFEWPLPIKDYLAISAKKETLVINFDQSLTISDQLCEMLDYVRIREKAILEAPDPILLNSHNIAAGFRFSPQVLFEQSCRLEKCLENNEIASHQVKAVNDQITTWGAQLYDKFAEMILEASSEQNITERFHATFDPSKSANQHIMSLVYERLLETFNHMKKSEFFKDLYENKTLHEKYDFMFDYCEFISRNDQVTTELRAVAEHLYDYIPLKAYQSCQNKKSALVSDVEKSLTIQDVFTKLATWSSLAWRRHKDQQGGPTALLDELNNMLIDDQKNLEAWEKIEALDSVEPRKKAAYEVFAYRFATSEPNADPHAMLKKLQPVVEVPSPAANIVVVPNSSELISLTAFLNGSEKQENDSDDYLLPHPSFTPGADGAGIVRPGNPLAASLPYLPSLTELFCDDDLILRKTPTKSHSKY